MNLTLNDFIASGTTAERTAFVPDPPTPASGPDYGYLWWDTDLQAEYAYDFGTAAWVATGGGGGSGTVTNTGTLTANALIVGNGGVDVTALGSLGTTTTVLHGNAAGDPTFGAVDLTADVTGDLPLANLAQASAASKLLGRGSASGGGDYQEISVGTGLSFSGTTLSASAAAARAITFVIDGGGSAITTGIKADVSVPYACTITAVTMLADQSGSIVVDIWKDTYANYPPTVADTITASAKPTISAATKSTDSTLTGWTTSIGAGDTLRFNVDSATTVTRLSLTLTVTV